MAASSEPEQPTKPQKPYSAHIFIFPFKWRSFNSGQHAGTPFSQKVRMDAVRRAVETSGNWQTFQFKPQPEADYFNSYNEYAYFHDYARDALGVNYKANPNESSVVQAQYEYRIHGPNPTYRIDVKGQDQPFSLKINSITLNFYESGVGVLAFHLENHETPDFNKILKINDYGRRIYPQYLGGFSDEQSTDAEGKPAPNLLNSPQYSFLPLSIQLDDVAPKTDRTQPETQAITENFSHYATRAGIAEAPFVLPAHISRLLGDGFKTRFQQKNNGDIVVSPVLDDRMFLLCFVFNDQLAAAFKQYDEPTDAYAWENHDDWYRFIFVDGDVKPTIDSRSMKRALIRQSSYDRWVESHLFGVTRYSFVVLTTDTWFTRNIVFRHFSNQYFQMALLTLIQRASILSFSAEAAWISDHLPRATGLRARTINNIADLYLSYTKFIQKIYFREVTPQEQGIELYDLLQDRLTIKNNVEDLGREMGELNQFVEAQQQRSISWITYVLLPISLILSFFGLNYFGGENPMYVQPGRTNAWGSPELWSVCLIAFFCFAAVFILSRPRWLKRS